jgi:uncharacterized protein with ParB-like and HNH nuclease domain
MSNLLYTVKEIFGDDDNCYLQIHKKKFFNIPVYQRGFKWKATTVKKLLVDINNFHPEGDKFYCLQNITLVPNKDSDVFNVVDGQQRLTTLVVILSYLGQKDLVKGKVRFPEKSIREETNKFLNDIITKDNANLLQTNWDSFIEEFPDFNHQDIYYLFTAYQAINDWFNSEMINKELFLEKILTHVRIIANSISDDSKEEKIFGNLNSKRIPLDGADLVRAILITRVANEEGQRDSNVKNIVRVNERRVRIGWELDEINNWWSKKEVNSFFKRFISIKSDEINDGNKLFKDDKYPINLLLLLFAEKKGQSKLTLEFIEEKNNDTLWLYKEILKLHNTLKDWFYDREIYHYLGFLFYQSKFKFKELWDYWQDKNETRNDFKQFLIDRIKLEVFNGNDDTTIFSDSTNWYDNEKDSLIKILILLDVYWSTKKNQPFLPFSAFEKSGHDIEHIFPQNPKEIKDKKTYIRFLIVNKFAKPNKKLEQEFDTKLEDPDFQKRVDEFILKYVGQIKTNSIGNLVLLDASKNRSIGNNPYSIKRAALVDDINRGTYMRPHTLKVFVRYFDTGKNENQDAIHWTNTDIDANVKAIEKTLSIFLNS